MRAMGGIGYWSNCTMVEDSPPEPLRKSGQVVSEKVDSERRIWRFDGGAFRSVSLESKADTVL